MNDNRGKLQRSGARGGRHGRYVSLERRRACPAPRAARRDASIINRANRHRGVLVRSRRQIVGCGALSATDASKQTAHSLAVGRPACCMPTPAPQPGHLPSYNPHLTLILLTLTINLNPKPNSNPQNFISNPIRNPNTNPHATILTLTLNPNPNP